MRRHCLLVLALVLLTSASALAQAPPPASLGGIDLGADVARFGRYLSPGKGRPAEDAPYLTRRNIKPSGAFRGGYVLAGTCFSPGRVARIKLKYADEGQDFFRRLSGALMDRYGLPTEYKGDLEGQVLGNKWTFTNDRGESVSLIVQHSDADGLDHDQGNIIKLTNWGLVDAERSCFESRHPKATPPPSPAPASLDGYLPR
ncbi:hypothetical protein [Desulfolutivibrio sulfoxidireducens]|uniref:hypothetical protein n=1 Tax=Desulfolutivibrio sulfoxidireducens TaxID=2773299 RepID=UPI00159DC271|nr:hypothetical protein [Desulfolutivibrio sulfoxidireducens]QLA16033.1 hypothetical protein GD605_07740 [Desulfolutivibrio sulfoxidireducens]QLA20058.1 hypothetical protein GD604_10145 [Desulfolutivibrio sulfoxidireducens]